MNQYNLFAYCFNNPINMVDYTGTWPEWVNAGFKVLAVVAIAVTTAMVITGTGGLVAVIALGAACSAATGGYFNEQAGGHFTSGYIGGAVSGLIQGLCGQACGPAGLVVGGGLGSGIGTAITLALDNYCAEPDKKISNTKIFKDSVKSMAIGFTTS